MTIDRLRRTAVIAAAILANIASRPAHAQSAEAEVLFREGKRLLKKGDIAEACEKFEASDRLEPSAGTKLNLADCREQNGQLATAWSTFIKAAAAAKRADKDGKREAEARRRAAALEPKLVYLTIKVPDDIRVDGLTIKRNDTVLDEELWNERVPIDPDEYRISAEAPGRESWSKTITVRTKDKSIEVPELAKSERSEPSDDKSRDNDRDDDRDNGDVDRTRDDEDRDTKKSRRKRADDEVEAPSTFTSMRKGAVVLGIVGAGAIAGGVVFGLRANELARRSDAICPDIACPDAQGIELNKQARSNALFANVGFVAGGVLVAGAVVMWIAGGPNAPAGAEAEEPTEGLSVTPMLGADRLGFALGGRF